MSEDPIVKAIGDTWWVIWSGPQVTFEFARFSEHRDTLSAEVTIVSATIGPIHWARVNLASTPGRTALVKAAEELDPAQPWRAYVDRSCQLVAQALRRGEPAEFLVPEAPRTDRWVVDLVLPVGDVTVLFGDGGSAKSLLALTLGVYGLLGHPVGAWSIAPLRRILYLDWETDARAHRERLYGLTRGLETPPADAILYRRLFRPLTDDLSTVRTDADRHRADLVICDSLAPACGLEPEGADAAVRTLMALRALPGTKLVIAHVSKAQADQARGARPFGSVHVQNLARSVLEVRRRETGPDESETLITVHHRKSNHGRLAGSVGLAFAFDEITGGISVRRASADTSGAPLPMQILEALRSGKKDANELAEETASSVQSVRTALSRLAEKNKVIRLEAVSGGRGKKQLWGLKIESASSEYEN